MATSCSLCGPGAPCHRYALMKEPGNWRSLLIGKNWLGPFGSRPFVVGGSGMYNWYSVAGADGWGSPWDLIQYNFGTRDAREVNWYLYHFVGCRVSNDGNKNLSFHRSQPGIIYTRRSLYPGTVPTLKKPEVPATGPADPVEPVEPLYRRDLSWVGFGVQAGGMGLIAGHHGFTAYMINIGDPECQFFLSGVFARAGMGVGGSGSTVAAVVTGLYDPEDVRMAPDREVDFQIAIGGRWLGMAKNLTKVPHLKPLLSAARLKTHITDPRLIKTVANSAKNIIKASGIDLDSTELKATVIDLGIGAGQEASLFAQFGSYYASGIRLTPEPYELD